MAKTDNDNEAVGCIDFTQASPFQTMVAHLLGHSLDQSINLDR